MTTDVIKTSNSRVFTITDRAGPTHVPQYQSYARAGAVSWAQGDRQPVRNPSDEAYGQYKVIDFLTGEPGLPELPIEFRKQFTLSEILKIVRTGCPMDIQVHYGQCQNPQDFNGGWDLVSVLENAAITNYSTGEQGSFTPGDDTQVLETAAFTGLDYYEVKRVLATAIAGTEIVQEVVGVTICDSRSCGTCGSASDGCQKVFAVTMSAGASPGLPAEIIYSGDGGATIGQTNISTLAANQDPTDIGCVGTRLVVTSNESESIHIAITADVLAGTATWQEVTSGFVASSGPNAIFSLGATFTWFAGDNGYIYFADDVTASVTAQTAGTVTVENLNDIHGIDKNNLVAVGDGGAVLVTRNGGNVWALATAPAAQTLNAVWMHSRDTWYACAADGKLWYTENGGQTWTEKTFSGSGSGSVEAIYFSTPTVGWMSHTTAAGAGRIFRTIDGGQSWYIIPEDEGVTIPTNDRINALVGCGADPNLLFAGGLGADAADGILMKAA